MRPNAYEFAVGALFGSVVASISQGWWILTALQALSLVLLIRADLRDHKSK